METPERAGDAFEPHVFQHRTPVEGVVEAFDVARAGVRVRNPRAVGEAELLVARQLPAERIARIQRRIEVFREAVLVHREQGLRTDGLGYFQPIPVERSSEARQR